MLAAGLFMGCTNTDAPPPFFDMDYQVRCKGDCNNAIDNNVRTITNLDSEDGYRVQCDVSGSGADRVVNASFGCAGDEAECGGDYAFEIADLRIDGNDPGAGCRIYVTEGSNTYEGACTATEPTADAPCQISIDSSGGEINGSVLCQNIPNAANQTERRGLFGPRSEGEAMFNILNCAGL